MYGTGQVFGMFTYVCCRGNSFYTAEIKKKTMHLSYESCNTLLLQDFIPEKEIYFIY